MVGGRGKREILGKRLLRQATMDFVPRISYIFFIFIFLFFPCNGTNANIASCTPDLVIARAFMPVAIRSLNGHYGFLDSLRSLEMTTVTEQMPI